MSDSCGYPGPQKGIHIPGDFHNIADCRHLGISKIRRPRKPVAQPIHIGIGAGHEDNRIHPDHGGSVHRPRPYRKASRSHHQARDARMGQQAAGHDLFSGQMRPHPRTCSARIQLPQRYIRIRKAGTALRIRTLPHHQGYS